MDQVANTEVLWAFTVHPDTPLNGREHVRHKLRTDKAMRTLCGLNAVWVFDYATPLSPTCKVCARSSREFRRR